MPRHVCRLLSRKSLRRKYRCAIWKTAFVLTKCCLSKNSSQHLKFGERIPSLFGCQVCCSRCGHFVLSKSMTVISASHNDYLCDSASLITIAPPCQITRFVSIPTCRNDCCYDTVSRYYSLIVNDLFSISTEKRPRARTRDPTKGFKDFGRQKHFEDENIRDDR